MKLEKFNKNKKQKEIIIGAILILIGVIGGIGLYRSFAMYEEKQTFDVLKGTVPDFRIGKGDINIIALKVNGEKTNTVPLKADYSDIKTECDNSATGVWNKEEWGLKITNVTIVPTSCTVEFILDSIEFDYLGKEQTFIAPIEGKYKLEVWGAEGGKTGSVQGGYGGYAKGEINLTQGEELFIYVGEKGSTTSQGASAGTRDTFNGGGGTIAHSDGGTICAQGGGATHIALVTGLLSTLEKQKSEILIVAGGGGGNGRHTAFQNTIPGSGGGYLGVNSADFTHDGITARGYGGTQAQGGGLYYSGSATIPEVAKGSFGQGGRRFGSGGGGFYGGGSAGYPAGGGSGYIGNARLTNKEMWCYKCEESDAEETRTHTTNNISSDAVSQNAKQGNGYAKITYLGSN